MFDSFQNSPDRNHTVVVALLAAAFLFIPALVAFSQPSSYLPAIGASVLCLTVAWFQWKRSLKASIPGAAIDRKGAK